MRDEKAPPRWTRWVERIFWTALLVWLAVRLAPQASALTGIGARGEPAAALALQTLDGARIAPADLEGRVVVLNFWATWCLPCRVEMPALQRLHERYAGDGLVIVGLATDGHDRDAVMAFLRERGITFPVGAATLAQRADFGGIERLPTTILIDRGGRIRHEVEGLFAPAALRTAVRRLLREPRPGG